MPEPIKGFAPRTNPAGVSFITIETIDTLTVPMATTSLPNITAHAHRNGKTLVLLNEGQTHNIRAIWSFMKQVTCATASLETDKHIRFLHRYVGVFGKKMPVFFPNRPIFHL